MALRVACVLLAVAFVAASNSDALSTEFPAGVGGYSSIEGLPLPKGAHFFTDGPEIDKAELEETNGLQTPGSPPASTQFAGYQKTPNIVSYHQNMQARYQAENNLPEQIIRASIDDAQHAMAAQAVVHPEDQSTACSIPFQMYASPFPPKFRCSGCLSSMAALVSLMKADMNFANPQMAQYEFANACLFVESEYVQLCRYLYNVHGRHLVSMLFRNKLPLHICSCLNACDAEDIQIYTAAFSKPKKA
eukprot:gnl/Spiro4/24119_TR11965_c0_g1_i1.p2 gnl/Spiro4/24119_TR11965_c0_g1~~gnl/Spiro4/24119_TR11965_c0_g1_i1.p2  ORF type:complete len:260 (-),score=81.85 gnl/Spiro4/24119_TR11965_c0_g1_i1:158-898(-)